GRLLRSPRLVLTAYVGLLALTWWAFRTAPTGFVPQQDQGRLTVAIQLPDSASQERSREVVAVADQVVRDTPGVAHTVTL
ncbi:efflux RND transporter permease subunit, partial [Vibrio parahaemolyticus]